MRSAVGVMFGSGVVFFMLVGVPILVEVFVRVMKMHMSLADKLAHKVVESEEKERSSGDARKPCVNAVTNYRAK
jgi:hypothetical protein